VIFTKNIFRAHGIGTVLLGKHAHQLHRTAEEALQYELMQHGHLGAIHSIFNVLTEDQQRRVLEQLGWKEVK
jgi:hypothetical protein